MANIEIWSATVIFYLKNKDKKSQLAPIEIKGPEVITKRIPLKFIINDGLIYKRAIKNYGEKTLLELVVDPDTGNKKFKLIYNKKIGETN